jgi:hypothetical protein
MQERGAGRRWGLMDKERLHEHDLKSGKSKPAPLEQTFQRPEEKPFTMRLSFFSTRPRLGRVLANTFWIVHQGGRQSTLTASAYALRLLSKFLDYRKKILADVRSTRQLHQDLLKEMAVWLLVKRHLQRQTAARAISMCCWFLRQAKRLLSDGVRSEVFHPDQCISGRRKPTIEVQSAITGHISEDSEGRHTGD